MSQTRVEALGPVEQAIRTMTQYMDHLAHNRAGLVTRDPTSSVGVRWEPCTYRVQEGVKVVFRKVKVGKKTAEIRAGVLTDGGDVVGEGGVVVGEYRRPRDTSKLFPELVTYLYQQIVDIFKADQEFAARWASYVFGQDSTDMKTILAALMLVQPRSGEPVKNAEGAVIFNDDDYRSVGEAMFLIRGRGNREMQPKAIVRVGDILALPGVAEINRANGFGGKSGREPPMGRYPKAVTRWLRYRERNPAMLRGLVQAGMGGMVRELASRARYKPDTPEFFRIIGWKQKQNAAAHRTMMIGEAVEKTTWVGLDERAVCERVLAEKPSYKRLVGLLGDQQITPAIMAACLESGGISDADLIILTPTLETMGVLTKEPFASRWKAATQSAENQRAQVIASRVRTKEAQEGLAVAVDTATAKAMEKATRGLRVYVFVDKSGSMTTSIGRAKAYLAAFLGGFPLDRTHIAIFNTHGSEIRLKAGTREAVEHAFSGHTAAGGTLYGSGVLALSKYKPAPDEDALFLWVGDQEGERGAQLAQTIRNAGFNPVAFGMLHIAGGFGTRGNTVEAAAADLGIPCFALDENMFNGDPYAVTRVLRDLIANTPVGAARATAVVPVRRSLIEVILGTDLLQRPVWADTL